MRWFERALIIKIGVIIVNLLGSLIHLYIFQQVFKLVILLHFKCFEQRLTEDVWIVGFANEALLLYTRCISINTSSSFHIAYRVHSTAIRCSHGRQLRLLVYGCLLDAPLLGDAGHSLVYLIIVLQLSHPVHELLVREAGFLLGVNALRLIIVHCGDRLFRQRLLLLINVSQLVA